jgi:hypothetical protein
MSSGKVGRKVEEAEEAGPPLDERQMRILRNCARVIWEQTFNTPFDAPDASDESDMLDEVCVGALERRRSFMSSIPLVGGVHGMLRSSTEKLLTQRAGSAGGNVGGVRYAAGAAGGAGGAGGGGGGGGAGTGAVGAATRRVSL